MPPVRFDLRREWEYRHLDSQGGNVVCGYGVVPTPLCANVCQNFELRAKFVRLNFGSGNSGKPDMALASRLHRRRQVVPSGQANQQGDTRHAF